MKAKYIRRCSSILKAYQLKCLFDCDSALIEAKIDKSQALQTTEELSSRFRAHS